MMMGTHVARFSQFANTLVQVAAVSLRCILSNHAFDYRLAYPLVGASCSADVSASKVQDGHFCNTARQRSIMSKTTRHVLPRTTYLYLMLALLSACSSRPPINSDAFRWQKMIESQRAQCASLPEPLATNCLNDVIAKEKQQPSY
jgi:hypothetical protein